MAHLKLLHDCNHIVTAKEFKVLTTTVIKDFNLSGSKVDKLPVKNVFKIGEVLDLVNNVVISPEIYNLFSDSIVWKKSYNPTISGKYRVPAPNEAYQVTLKYLVLTFTKYNPAECPQCNNTGWYMSPLSDGLYLDYQEGSYLVAQEFLKALFTILGTDRLNPNYGSSLLPESGLVNLDNNTINHIKTAISMAEINCKEQYVAESNRGYEEILDKVIIDSVETDENIGGILVYLTLLTAAGNRIRLSLRA